MRRTNLNGRSLSFHSVGRVADRVPASFIHRFCLSFCLVLFWFCILAGVRMRVSVRRGRETERKTKKKKRQRRYVLLSAVITLSISLIIILYEPVFFFFVSNVRKAYKKGKTKVLIGLLVIWL